MANKNFGKNLLMALGSLRALSEAINPSMSAMEGVKNSIDEKNEKYSEILNEQVMIRKTGKR